ncbi:hypothetical protein CASFOL_005504 [Castilleja foliolosa]|uniref:Tr-type G domain-containing protein n=1 Tax=Castilleja foliolosa TaxID=1961234 RepID=A0ABD3E3N9_9LAMI
MRMKIASAIASKDQLLRRRLPRVISGDNLLRPYDEYKVHGQVKAKEITPPEDLEDDSDDQKKRHLNVVFIGHVGSKTCKKLLFAKPSFVTRVCYTKAVVDCMHGAIIIKGKTVEVGRAYFETETSIFTILDAPGHNSYVPNMISGASQADVGVPVITARKGEFETGYERGGQTRGHIQIAKTLGVTKLLVVVNKMDDPNIQWSKERFDDIESKMTIFLKSSVYNVRKDVQFFPISGLMGTNMKTRMGKSVCPWWNGPCLFEVLDAIEIPLRAPKGPFRMPIIDKFKDMGTVVMGNIESGSIREGDNMFDHAE